MLTISAKGVYGLTAVLELGVNYNRGPIQIRDIAEAHGIPQHYLEQLLVILKKAGLVESFRGSQGGYALARNPGRIRIPDVLACLEGELSIIPEEKKNGVLKFFWNRLEREIAEIIELTLEDLLLERQKYEKQLIYNI